MHLHCPWIQNDIVTHSYTPSFSLTNIIKEFDGNLRVMGVWLGVLRSVVKVPLWAILMQLVSGWFSSIHLSLVLVTYSAAAPCWKKKAKSWATSSAFFTERKCSGVSGAVKFSLFTISIAPANTSSHPPKPRATLFWTRGTFFSAFSRPFNIWFIRSCKTSSACLL